MLVKSHKHKRTSARVRLQTKTRKCVRACVCFKELATTLPTPPEPPNAPSNAIIVENRTAQSFSIVRAVRRCAQVSVRPFRTYTHTLYRETIRRNPRAKQCNPVPDHLYRTIVNIGPSDTDRFCDAHKVGPDHLKARAKLLSYARARVAVVAGAATTLTAQSSARRELLSSVPNRSTYL